MDIRTQLYNHLRDYVDLAEGRVFPLTAPELDPDTQEPVVMPYLVYSQVTKNLDMTHEGFSGLTESYFQVSCFGMTYEETALVAGQVTVALLLFREVTGIGAAFPSGEAELREPESGIFHCPVTFRIYHNL